MSLFPETTTIQLAQDKALEEQPLTIKGDNATGFEVDYPGNRWTFPPGSELPCALIGGTEAGTQRTLEIQGSCDLVSGLAFRYLIGITRDPLLPPDDHVVEWVAEDEG